MPCYHPQTAYKTAAGLVTFTEGLKRHGDTRQITLSCGQCHGCRLERSRQWAMRCVHEAKLHQHNSFITLTYDKENLPHRNQLQHSDFQKFMKRLRKRIGHPVRFYMGGEYGSKNGRPHYHACIFGWEAPDKKYYRTTDANGKLYTSELLANIWGHGYSSTAELTFESAAYIARYCMQKVTGQAAETHYKREDENGVYQQIPEYNKMSLKPGIGTGWLEKYRKDVYTYDHVIINGKPSRPPAYYDKLLKRWDAEKHAQITEEREARGILHRHDNTPERLDAKEQFAKAKTRSLVRGKI